MYCVSTYRGRVLWLLHSARSAGTVEAVLQTQELVQTPALLLFQLSAPTSFAASFPSSPSSFHASVSFLLAVSFSSWPFFLWMRKWSLKTMKSWSGFSSSSSSLISDQNLRHMLYCMYTLLFVHLSVLIVLHCITCFNHKTQHLNIILLRHIIGRYRMTADIYMLFLIGTLLHCNKDLINLQVIRISSYFFVHIQI